MPAAFLLYSLFFRNALFPPPLSHSVYTPPLSFSIDPQRNNERDAMRASRSRLKRSRRTGVCAHVSSLPPFCNALVHTAKTRVLLRRKGRCTFVNARCSFLPPPAHRGSGSFASLLFRFSLHVCVRTCVCLTFGSFPLFCLSVCSIFWCGVFG